MKAYTKNNFFLDLYVFIIEYRNLSQQTSGRGNLKRYAILAVAFVWFAVNSVSPCQAQIFGRNLAVDADMGFGYLFGSQAVWANVNPHPWNMKHDYKVQYSPSQPMFNGNIEITPVPFISCRLGGSLSLSRATTVQSRNLGPLIINPLNPTTATKPWDVTTDIKTWETAGLLNLWRGIGYRFSLVGGYREQFWDYSGDIINSPGVPGSMNDEINNYVPFLGLQTAMFFPLWKARFEIIGSRFMMQKVNNNAWLGPNFVDYRAELDDGGLIEIDFEGSAILYSSLRIGLYCHYSYMELEGRALVNSSGLLGGLDPRIEFNSAQNTAEMGLKLNLNF